MVARALPFLVSLVVLAGCTPILPRVDAGAAVDASRPVDAGLDARPAPADAGTHAPADAPVDAGTDAGPPPIACADGTEDEVYPGGRMVGCNGAADQCTAETLCGAGWHLCTYSELVARGGDTQMPLVDRWIASCVRDAPSCAPAPAPADTVCSSCVRTTPGTVTVAQLCGASGPGTVSSLSCPVGVATAAATQAQLLAEPVCLWVRPRTTTALIGATCCF